MTRAIFFAIVAALAVQRLVELRWSKRNEARILAGGGREHAAGQFRFMKALHVGWFAAMVVEVVWLDRPFVPLLAAAGLVGVAAGQALRYAAIRTLGWRWTVRIMTLPGAAPIDRGIYRHLRHPNYLGVVLEICAVPLLHSAFLTAIVFSSLNALLLRARIQAEEQALSEHGDYARTMVDRPRFLPRCRYK